MKGYTQNSILIVNKCIKVFWLNWLKKVRWLFLVTYEVSIFWHNISFYICLQRQNLCKNNIKLQIALQALKTYDEFKTPVVENHFVESKICNCFLFLFVVKHFSVDINAKWTVRATKAGLANFFLRNCEFFRFFVRNSKWPFSETPLFFHLVDFLESKKDFKLMCFLLIFK